MLLKREDLRRNIPQDGLAALAEVVRVSLKQSSDVSEDLSGAHSTRRGRNRQ